MEWRYPWVIICFGFLLFFWIGQFLRRGRSHFIFKSSTPQLEANLLGRFDHQKRLWKKRMGLFGLSFLIVSASGPQIGTKVKPVERKGVDLVFVVDISISMDAEDVKPSRLQKAKFEISQIIKQLKGDRVGIIVFAGSSHIYLPLTADYEAAQLFLDGIDTNMIPTQGTSISSALNSGLTAFITEESKKYKVIIIITDGEDHEGEAVEIAEKAARTGIIIHTVGVGSLTGSLIPIKSQNGVSQEYKRDRQGKLVTSKLNEMALREIADAGNGIYVRFDNRLTGHRNLIQAIDSMEKKTISTHEFSEFEDRYQVFAIISLLFFIIGFMFPTKKMQKDTWRGRIV